MSGDQKLSVITAQVKSLTEITEREVKESPAKPTIIPGWLYSCPKTVCSKEKQHQRLLIAEKIDFTKKNSAKH